MRFTGLARNIPDTLSPSDSTPQACVDFWIGCVNFTGFVDFSYIEAWGVVGGWEAKKNSISGLKL